MFPRNGSTFARQKQAGFTLLELLVVVAIIAIVAAIAIPVFLRQREKAYVADVQSLLRNGATAMESFAAGNGGSYIGAGASQEWSDLRVGGSQSKNIDLEAIGSYCIEATDSRLSGGHDWATGHFGSLAGSPETGPCP
jgi:prepilin-type N-terminal cleavage/methylation domain-containing protein